MRRIKSTHDQLELFQPIGVQSYQHDMPQTTETIGESTTGPDQRPVDEHVMCGPIWSRRQPTSMWHGQDQSTSTVDKLTSTDLLRVNVNNLLAISELGFDKSGEPGPQAEGVNYLETPLRQLHESHRASSCAK